MTASGKLRLPHPLALLTGCVLLAAAASYVLAAGEFGRRDDPVTGRTLVIPGTYQSVESNPVNLFEAMVALPRGMADAGSVIFLVFLIGGAFTVVDETGALRRAIPSLIRALRGRDLLVIPVVSLFFAMGGVVQNMQEEIIPLIPVLMILVGRLGFTPLGYFPLPVSCWLDHYYRPLQQSFPAFLEQHGHSAAARAIVAAEEHEIALYQRHKEHVSYGFYLAQKVGE